MLAGTGGFGTKLLLLACFVHSNSSWAFCSVCRVPVQAATVRLVFQAQWHFVIVVEIKETWSLCEVPVSGLNSIIQF